MRWPELLEQLETELALDLPDFVVKAGTWSIVPNVDAVHLQVAKEVPQGMGFTGYTLLIDLFVRVESGSADLDAYRKLDANQQLIEAALKGFHRDTGAVTSLKRVSWEPCGGAFVPTYGNRLECDVVCVTDDSFCGGSAPLLF